jgi:hypothetical protein
MTCSVRNTILFVRSDLMTSRGEFVSGLRGTVLECDDVDVVRDRIGEEAEEVTDSKDRFERVDVPCGLAAAAGRSSGPSRSTSHLHLKNSPRIELYGYC